MFDKNFRELEDAHAKLFVLRDLIAIVIDFIDNECPSDKEIPTKDEAWKAVVFANRTRMFGHALYAADLLLADADKQIENYICSEIKNRKDK